MTPTLTQIRAALQNLAAKKGRPDYELCTAKQVKYAMDNGIEHHLIAELPFFEITKEIDKPLRDVVPREYPSKEQEKELAPENPEEDKDSTALPALILPKWLSR